MVLGVTVCVKKRVVYQESGKELKSDIGKEKKCFVMCHALQTASARADGQERKRTICKAIDQHIASSSWKTRRESNSK
jgi:geranylgeranyl pyrophosphate synthase